MTAALPIRMVEKPWGMDVLPAPFSGPAGSRIGEIWFEPPAGLPTLLVKYIFTSEALSIQVHLVIAAAPGARIGIGFDRALDAVAMRAAALDGTIEHLLTWHAVVPGDFFSIPANTVHAIGAGVALIEIQQNSDITYRLYDYGRPRELHLDAGMAVADGSPYPQSLHRRLPPTGSARLVEGPFFRLDRVAGVPGPEVLADYDGQPLLVIPLAGEVTVNGEAIGVGACAMATSVAAVGIAAAAMLLLAQPLAGGR